MRLLLLVILPVCRLRLILFVVRLLMRHRLQFLNLQFSVNLLLSACRILLFLIDLDSL